MPIDCLYCQPIYVSIVKHKLLTTHSYCTSYSYGTSNVWVHLYEFSFSTRPKDQILSTYKRKPLWCSKGQLHQVVCSRLNQIIFSKKKDNHIMLLQRVNSILFLHFIFLVKFLRKRATFVPYKFSLYSPKKKKKYYYTQAPIYIYIYMYSSAHQT